jgi:two-component system response regulator HydG
MPRSAVLVIDDEPRMLEGLGKLLAQEGWEVHLASDGEAALRLLREQPVQVVLTDLRMPGLDGLAVLRQVRDLGVEAEVVLLTAHGSIDTAVQAIKQGAYDFLTKPPDTERLLHVLRRAAEHQALARRTRALEAAQPAGRPLIARSPAMRRVLELVAQVGPTDATVLIQGESGTGKEVVARALHAGSPRAGQPLVAVNCAAIPEALLEAELFGYERGAFTGAARRKPGRFELADGGTLFLDEVAELSPPAQAKLLRALQEREIERLGGTRPVPVDVRLLAATNHDLARLVADRRFREDLYYRLHVVTITLPPLRERPEDLLPLAEHFLARHARRLDKAVDGFADEALALMRGYRWPGNVRELEHAIERAVILARDGRITGADLGLPPDGPATAEPPTGTGTLAEMERRWILAALERAGGNQTEAAAALGIDRSTLHRKLRRYRRVGRQIDA